MRAVVRSAALIAGHARDLTITAEVTDEAGPLKWLGFPGAGRHERAARIWSAIDNSRYPFPSGKQVTVTASPAGLPSQCGTDLAIAIAILRAAGVVVSAPGYDPLFYAGLRDDGRLEPVPGAIDAALVALRQGDSMIVVAGRSVQEARLGGGWVFVGDALSEVVTWLGGGPAPGVRAHGCPQPPDVPDIDCVKGNDVARAAAEISAAGGHHLSLTGAPVAGAKVLAQAMPGIMPELSPEDVLEVTRAHSLAASLWNSEPVTRPPFRLLSPDMSADDLAGRGGGIAFPGYAPLAHGGILCLRDVPELAGEVFDALRYPLQYGRVTLACDTGSASFPARFTLVTTASPCGCQATGAGAHEIGCTPTERAAYSARVPDWLTARISLRAVMTPPRPWQRHRSAEASAVVRTRVTEARQRAAARLRETPWRLNAEIPHGELARRFPLDPAACARVEGAVAAGVISERAATDVLRTAWTIADLHGRPSPVAEDCLLALGFRKGEIL